MRTFTIITNGETITNVEADHMAVDDGVVSFWIGTGPPRGTMVGLARDWSVITSDPGREITLETALDMIDAVSGVSEVSRGELPEVPDPFDAFPEEDAVVNPPPPFSDEAREIVEERNRRVTTQLADEQLASDPPVAPPAERTTLDHDIEEMLVVSGARPEASEPDAPGVSTDPNPEPETAPSEDDVDAIPPASSPPESTDADHPSAAGEEAEMDALGLKINTIYGEHRQQPILVEFTKWAGEEGIPPQVTRMTLADRRRVVEWFGAQG